MLLAVCVAVGTGWGACETVGVGRGGRVGVGLPVADATVAEDVLSSIAASAAARLRTTRRIRLDMVGFPFVWG